MTSQTDPAPGSTHGGPYGWMTYTSFDMGTGTGGWQVKDRVDLSDAEVAELRSRINTQVSLADELPRFPSPEDVAAFPRRLLYAPCGTGTAWWHAVPAGADASGRPGNVFAHVVLDRWTSASTLRPIDLWRSADWLTPYGADAVNAATLQPQTAPHPGTSIDAASVIAFLLDLSTYRLGTLGALLDACAAATAGGARVVLITDTVDTAALWFGAVSCLMTAEQARRSLFFSTLERANSLAETFAQGVVLVSVPRADRGEVDQMPGVVVIDEAESISMGDVGGHPHRTEHGYEIVATEWSAMAQVVLMDTATAELVVARLDEMGGELTGAADPAWGLAIVVSQERALLADAEREAASVIMRSSPAAFTEDSPAFPGAATLVSDHLGISAEHAWTRLTGRQPGTGSGGAVTQMILGGYISRALADVDWLTAERPGGVPLPDQMDLVDRAEADAVGAALATLASLAAFHSLKPAGGPLSPVRGLPGPVEDPRHEQDARAVVAVADVVARLGLQDEDLDEAISQGLEASFIHLLFEPEATDLVSRIGPCAEITQATYLRPLVQNAAGLRSALPVGQKLAPAATAWLFPDDLSPVKIDVPLELDACRLRAERAAHLLLEDRHGHADERPLVVWATLADREAPRSGLSRHFLDSAWSPADVLTLRSSFSGAISPEWMGPTLKSSFPGRDLDRLCRDLLETGWTTDHLYDRTRGPVESLAWLRSLESQQWWHWTATSGPRQIERILAWAAAGEQWPDFPFAGSTLRIVAVAGVLAGMLGTPGTTRAALTWVRAILADPQTNFDAEQITQLTEGGDRLSFNRGKLCVAAMSTDEGFPDLQLPMVHNQWMRTCVVTEGAGPVPVLVVYLRHVVQQEIKKVDQLRDETRKQLDFVVVDHRERRAVEKFVTAWFRTHFAGSAVPGRRKAQHS